MIIFWKPSVGSGSCPTSTNPGVQNVLAGVSYMINGVSYTGTASPVSITIAQAQLSGQSTASVLGGQKLSATLVQS